MKKTIKRSGFTIVELVIVIAVIAVLAGVLIPTFGGIIERANESNDNQVVATINKLLVVDNIIKGDDPNDAVEIKKMLKDNGVSLKTKSEGKYIWYDIDQNKVILAGLDASGIVFLNENDKDPKASATKGQFKGATAPELFIDGYVFLSDESDDGLAQAICGLRNPKGEGKDNAAIVEAMKVDIGKSLEKINKENANLHTQLSALMNRTAVMTEAGVVFWGSNSTDVTKIIISSEMKNVTESSVSGIKNTYPNIIVVDFHSGVTNIDNPDAVNSTGIYFVYNNDEIYAIDHKDGGDYTYLITKDERGKFIKEVELIYVDEGGHQIGTGDANVEFLNYTFTHDFPYLPDHSTKKDNVETFYAFKYYSLYKDDTEGIQRFTSDKKIKYELSEDQKHFVDGEGKFIIYAIFEKATQDFQINDGSKYSSRYMTYMLANGKVTDNSVIKVIRKPEAEGDKGPTLGNETYKTLTIPSTVTLLVPHNDTQYSRSKGIYNPKISSTNKTYGKFDKDIGIGHNMLTITNGVTLTNNGYITVDALLHKYSHSHFGFVEEDCGVLVVGENSTIVNESGSRMEAYGIVRGAGNVTAASGSSIIETMSVLDLHGGQTTIASIMNDFSPFNRYTIDSIRLPLTIKHGATYSTYAVIQTSLGEHNLEFKIAGATRNDRDTANNPLFWMDSNAEIVKTYNNGIHISISGKVEDCKKKISLGYTADVATGGFTFETCPLPISEFDITVESGATLKLSNATAYKILPGSDWVINGTLDLGCRMVVYDSFVLDGGDKSVVDSRTYTGTNAFSKTNATLTVNGKLILNSGAQLAGIVEGGTKNAEIQVISGAETSNVPEVKEAGNGKYLFISISSTVDKYTVKNFSWTGRWQTGLNDEANPVYETISETANTYYYNNYKWSTTKAQ